MLAGALPRLARAAAPAELTIATRSLEVGGRAATVFGIIRPVAARACAPSPARISGCG